MNRLAEVFDRPEPTMVATFAGRVEDSAEAHIASAVELRADLLPIVDPSYVLSQASRLAIMPVLFTARTRAEGGRWFGTEAKRLGLVSDVISGVDGVDAELTAGALAEIIGVAHDNGKAAVVSSHEYKRTPPLYILEDRLIRAKDAGADYVKFALRADTIEEYELQAEFAKRHAGDKVAIMAMGNYGPKSRKELPGEGSLFTYGYAGERAVAAGQMSCLETHADWVDRYPAYAALFE